MYIILIKEKPRSSWKAEQRVFDDREKADAVANARKVITGYHRVIVVYVNIPD